MNLNHEPHTDCFEVNGHFQNFPMHLIGLFVPMFMMCLTASVQLKSVSEVEKISPNP